MPLKGKDAVKRSIRGKASKLMRALLLEILARLIRRTPVDTGRARQNWNVGVNAIDRSADTDAAGRSGSGASSRGAAKILAEFEPGDVGFITNALDYVQELERGHSSQAPEGMVAVTAAEVRPLVARILAELAYE